MMRMICWPVTVLCIVCSLGFTIGLLSGRVLWGNENQTEPTVCVCEPRNPVVVKVMGEVQIRPPCTTGCRTDLDMRAGRLWIEELPDSPWGDNACFDTEEWNREFARLLTDSVAGGIIGL